MFFRQWVSSEIDFLELMINSSLAIAVVTLLISGLLATYFGRRLPRREGGAAQSSG